MLHFIFDLISIRVSLIFFYLIKETILKMGACPAHSSFLVSSFVQPVADDPKRGLPSFLVAYIANLNVVAPLRGNRIKTKKNVTVKSSFKAQTQILNSSK